MYVKYGGDECKFFCMENKIVSLIGEKIPFGTFWVILDNIDVENTAKLKLAYGRGFNFVCSVTPKQSILV